MFGRKKTSAVDKRLEDLQREMSRVRNELKTLARQEKNAEDLRPLTAVKPRFGGAESAEQKKAADDPAASSTVSTGLPPAQKAAAVGGSPSVSNSGNMGGGDLPLFEPRAPLSSEGRQKFANYFMAGHFQNLRPLRLEKRIVRNKAIVMIVLAALVLIWVFFLLSS